VARRKASSEVLLPNLGVYFNVPNVAIPERGLQDCLNVRIQEGQLTNLNVGWTRFSADWQLNGQATLIDNFFDSSGSQKLIFASLTDVYEWVESTDEILYLTPRYIVGQAACAGGTTTVTGSGGTLWLANVKAGDAIHFGSNTQRNPTATEQPAGPNATWFTVQSVTDNTTIVLTANGPNTGGAVNYTIRRRMTMDSNDVWATDLFHNGLPGPDDWWVGTNGVDAILRWNGTDTQMEYMTSIGFVCKTLLRWKNMIIYGNLNAGGAQRRASIANSAIGDPFNTSTGEANEYIAYDGVDDILALLTIADNLVIYSTRNITIAALVGLPEFLVFRSAISGIGPLGPNAIADFGDNHEFLGSDAAYEFDGISTIEINYQVMREVIRKTPPNRYNQINAHFAEETGEIWWITPQVTDATENSPEIAYSEHYLEEVDENTPTPFTIREIPATCTGFFERLNTLTWDEILTAWSAQNYRWDDRFFQGAFPFNLFGTTAGIIFIMGTADSQNGAPISSFVRFGLRPVVDGRRRGIVKRVYPFATQFPGAATYSLGVKVHVSDQMGQETTDTGTFLYDLRQNGSRRFVNPFVAGRFFSVEFGTNGIDNVWTLQGYDGEVANIGERGEGG